MIKETPNVQNIFQTSWNTLIIGGKILLSSVLHFLKRIDYAENPCMAVATRAPQAHSTSFLLDMSFTKINEPSVNFPCILTIF